VLAALTAAFVLSIPALGPGHAIPKRYTCDGAQTSPALRWKAPPRGAKGFAVYVLDRDAGPYTHWTLWDLPPTSRGIPAGTKWAKQGRNSFGDIGYAGPCPPSGRHRYVFTVYALKQKLGLRRGASVAEFLRVLPRRVLGTATVTGTYSR
jgi:Raf kinase inhibitor-like YbhB/YbcL family protein